MKKQLILLLIVSLVAGTIPSMASPAATGDATGGDNWNSINIQQTGWNMDTSKVDQILTSNGAQSNEATTTSTSGNAFGYNPSLASNTAIQGTGSADGSGRDSDPTTGSNEANDNSAEATSGDSNVNSGDSFNVVVQANVIFQMATASVSTTQALNQEIKVEDSQDSNANTVPYVIIEDANILENNDNNQGGWGDLIAGLGFD